MFKSKLWLMCGTSLLAALLVGQVFAQGQEKGQGRRGGGFGGFGGMTGGLGPLQLVMMEPVQKELAISEEQGTKLKAIGEELRTEMQAAMGGTDFQALAQLSDEERTKKMTELRAKMAEGTKKINETFLPKVKEVLDSSQSERLQQIVWQAAGSQALQDQKLASALKLNKEQQDKLATIGKDYQAKQQELFGGGGAGGDIQERMAKVRELGEARDKQAMEVLTAEQKEQLEKLKGKPFDVAQLRRGFGGGGQGGPGGRKGGDRPQRPGSDKDK